MLRRDDFRKIFILYIDWSAFGIGAILGQLDEEDKEYTTISNNIGNAKFAQVLKVCSSQIQNIGNI